MQLQQSQTTINLMEPYLVNSNQQQTNFKPISNMNPHSTPYMPDTSSYYDSYPSYTLHSPCTTPDHAMHAQTPNPDISQTQTMPTAETNEIDNNETEAKEYESMSQSTTSSTVAEGESEVGSMDTDHDYDDLLILMDWDDTLYPTSMMNAILQSRDNNDLAMVRDEQIELIHALAGHTLVLLTDLISKYGANNIHIVSNSLEGWIRESLSYAACISTIYKDIEALLIENDITICSAQSMFATKANQNPTTWKSMCFGEILNGNKTKQSYSHILSIGDQWIDHYAVKQSINALTSYSPIHHIIKLKITPNLNDMMNEILYIKTCFDQIFNVISCKKTQFYANPQSVHPVVIDYHHEELKYYSNMNINMNTNVNVNVNLNVNVVSNDTPKQCISK
eukprot:156581_1